MKAFLLSIAIGLLCTTSHAQVSIANPASTPDPSAMLDVKSTNRGFLMPRVANRTDVASPATGLMIFETATNSVLLYSGGWVQLGSGSGGGQWLNFGAHIYNGNIGNVGIGINLPTAKFHVVGNMKQEAGTLTLNNAAGEINFQNAGVDKAFLQLSGNNLRMGTVSTNDQGRFIVRTNAGDRLIVDSTGNVRIAGEQDASLTSHGYLTLGSLTGTNLIFDNNELMARNNGAAANLVMQNNGGNVGIGVASPTDRLHLAGNVQMDGASPLIKMEAAVGGTGTPFASLRYTPGLQFLRQGSTTVLGKIEYVDTAGFSNFLRLYTGNISRNDLTVNTDHNVGIGTADAQAKLHITDGTGEQLRITALDPIIQFTTRLLSAEEKKGYLRMNNYDMVIGTNTANNTGNFIVTTNGVESIKVNASGNVGIGLGAGNPAAKLHVAGKIFANAGGEAIRIEGPDPAINFFQNGTQRGYVYSLGNDMQIGASLAAGKVFLNGSKLIVTSPKVEIGTSIPLPDGYRLGVGGKVYCEELRVRLQSNGWPDYVFSDRYQLMPLNQLKTFIAQNNHLPNIPKAAVVEKEGFEVGDMNKRLLEKVEELTLYILDLQKQIDELKARNQKQ